MPIKGSFEVSGHKYSLPLSINFYKNIELYLHRLDLNMSKMVCGRDIISEDDRGIWGTLYIFNRCLLLFSFIIRLKISFKS